MEERTVSDMLASGKVDRIRIAFDARQTGVARAHATVHLADEESNVSFYGDDVAAVATWLGAQGVAEEEKREEGEAAKTE